MDLSLDAFLTKRAGDRRLARLTHDVALPVSHGLEIGASNNPTALPGSFTVEYVDYLNDPDAHVPDAVAVDHVWTGAGSLASICKQTDHYDFAIASQVAQYVPNLLGWFRGLYEVLKVGGVLNLSLPDRRFMFDVKRKTSTLGELIEAYYLDYARPSARQLFDHTFEASAIATSRLWAEDVPLATIPRLSGDYALDLAHVQAQKTLAGETYVTCHCWVFTPLSFLDLIEGATRLGLFPFVISQFSSTEPREYEFFVSMRRDAERAPDALRNMQLGAIAHVRDIAELRMSTARRLGAE